MDPCSVGSACISHSTVLVTLQLIKHTHSWPILTKTNKFWWIMWTNKECEQINKRKRAKATWEEISTLISDMICYWNTFKYLKNSHILTGDEQRYPGDVISASAKSFYLSASVVYSLKLWWETSNHFRALDKESADHAASKPIHLSLLTTTTTKIPTQMSHT